MSAFERITAANLPQTSKPLGTLELKPEHFASSWGSAPVAPILFGLRLPSEREIHVARAEAAKVAVQLHGADDVEHRVEAFNDALMALAVARCLCDPEDARRPHPILPFADDMVRDAFPSRTIKMIWDRLERLACEQSPLVVEASDDDLMALSAVILTGKHREIDSINAARFRRYATYALEMIPAGE